MKPSTGKISTKTSSFRTYIFVFKRVLWLAWFLSLVACSPQPTPSYEENLPTEKTPMASANPQDSLTIPTQTSQPEEQPTDRSDRWPSQ